MSPAELARITELGRRRGAELAATGLVARKVGVLKTLGWPEAVRRSREARSNKAS